MKNIVKRLVLAISALAFLSCAASIAQAASFEQFGFRKLGNIGAGVKGGLAAEYSASPSDAESDEGNARVPVFSGRLVFDAAAGRLAAIDDVAKNGADGAVWSAVAVESGYAVADLFDIAHNEKEKSGSALFLLAGTGRGVSGGKEKGAEGPAAEGSFLVAGKYSPAASLKLEKSLMVKASDMRCSRIAGVRGEDIYLLSRTATRLIKPAVRIADGKVAPGGEAAKRDIDNCGAAVVPDGLREGSVLSLRANAGAVNTMMYHSGRDLSFSDARIVLNGETGGVALEAALPEGCALMSYVEYSGAAPSRSLILIDSFGAVYDLFKLGYSPFGRQVTVAGDIIYAMSFEGKGGGKDLSRGRLTVYSASVKELLSRVYSLRQSFGARGPARAEAVRSSVEPLSAFAAAGHSAGSRPPAGFVIPAPLETFETALAGFSMDATGEIFASDYIHFSTYKFGRSGRRLAKINNFAGITHGRYGSCFMVSEGRTRSHKVLLEFDNHGNFMRVLGEAELADPNARTGNAFCAGVDGEGRVYMLYFVKSALRIAVFDYRTGKLVKNAVTRHAMEGREMYGGYSVTKAGKIVFSARNGKEKENYVIDVWK